MKRPRRGSQVRQTGGKTKERRTFTLSRESVHLLNELCTARQGRRRRSVSAVLDELLRALDRQRRQNAADRAITLYYDNVDEKSMRDEKTWGEFSLAQFLNAED